MRIKIYAAVSVVYGVNKRRGLLGTVAGSGLIAITCDAAAVLQQAHKFDLGKSGRAAKRHQTGKAWTAPIVGLAAHFIRLTELHHGAAFDKLAGAMPFP